MTIIVWGLLSFVGDFLFSSVEDSPSNNNSNDSCEQSTSNETSNETSNSSRYSHIAIVWEEYDRS